MPAVPREQQALFQELLPEKEQQLWRICTPAAEQMTPRYAGDDQPDITYNQAHGLID